MTEIHCGCGASRLEDIMCADCGEYYRAGWIPVSEKYPPEEEYGASITVLALSGMNQIYEAYYDSDCDSWTATPFGLMIKGVTHWMPLPELPQEVE